MPKKTSTYSFGVSKREGHDSSPFYSRKIYSSDLKDVFKKIPDIAADKSKRAETKNGCEWKNKYSATTRGTCIMFLIALWLLPSLRRPIVLAKITTKTFLLKTI